MPNLLQVQKTDTFEQWRQKTNLTIDDINSLWGGGIIRVRANGIDVDYDNNEDSSLFNVTIDGISGFSAGEYFNISGIPEIYNVLGVFRILNISHTIDADRGWLTILDAMHMMKND